MARALYHPETGYYTRQIGEVGARGDFSTSATLGDGLGRALAAWLRKRATGMGWRGRIPVIEVGPGTGALARAVHRALPFWMRYRVEFHLVEVSQPLRTRQRETLRGCRVFWHDDMEAALQATGGRALIYSNELVDAFPCRCLIRKSGTWIELGVSGAPPFTEVEMESVDADVKTLGSMAANLWSPIREGQRIEVHTRYRDWLRAWAPGWHEGFLLTIDYGYVADPPPRLPLSGTIRAYFRQMRLEGEEVYRRMGTQDLTADVNFTDLQNWGSDLGWQTENLGSQADWIGSWVPKIQSRLADPHDAGGAFWVLEQSVSRHPPA